MIRVSISSVSLGSLVANDEGVTNGGEEVMEPTIEVNWANELDIDLDALMLERFHTGTHFRLLMKHKRRVARFEQHNRWVAFTGRIDDVGHQWRELEKLRGDRISASRRADRYNFSDELLEMASKALDAQDSV